eukprot:g18936.t1
MAACFLETSAQSSGTVGATSSGSRNRQAAERWTAYHPSAASVGQKGHPAEGLAQDLADPWPHAMDVAGPAPFAGDLQWVMLGLLSESPQLATPRPPLIAYEGHMPRRGGGLLSRTSRAGLMALPAHSGCYPLLPMLI